MLPMHLPQICCRCVTASSTGLDEGLGFGSVAPDGNKHHNVLNFVVDHHVAAFCEGAHAKTIAVNFDYASIHGDPMGGCSESSEDEESVPVSFSRH